MQIGNEKVDYPGKSHVGEKGGVPSWGGDTS